MTIPVTSPVVPSGTAGVIVTEDIATPTVDDAVAAEKPIPTATEVADVSSTTTQIPVIEVVPDTIDTSICVASNGNGSYGTAPGPTPTPTGNHTAGTNVDPEERQKASAALGYLVNSMNHWSSVFESDWSKNATPALQVEALSSLESRLAALCGAAADVSKMAGLNELRSQVVEGLRIRHAWAVLAIRQLLCCGDANVPEMNSGRVDTHQYLVALAESHGAGQLEMKTSDITYVLDGLNLRAVIPSNWLISQNTSRVTLLAPIDSQLAGTAGLGPDSFGIGTGIVIRTFGLPEAKTLESVVEQFGHLPGTRGVATAQENGILFGQLASWWLIDSDGWTIRFGMTVEGQNLYFTEYACPADKMSWCDDSSSLLDGIAIILE